MTHTTGILPTALMIKKALLPASTLFCRTENCNLVIYQFSLSFEG